MASTPRQFDLDCVGEVTWQGLVESLLGSNVEIISRKASKISTGMGAGTQIYRISGSARAAGLGLVDWGFVLKFLSLVAAEFQAISTEPSAWDYWKREWHVYRTSWLQQLSGPLVAARCIGTGEIQRGEYSQELAWIAMEDLGAYERRPWPFNHFPKVARQAGLFNGVYLSGQPIPAEPWLSHSWVRGWTEHAGQAIGQLLGIAEQWPIAQIFSKDMVTDLTRLWEKRSSLYETLERLPQTLCHNDLFPRNLFVRHDHPDQSVAIDWAFCGPGPVGQELSALLGSSLVFLESRPERWEDLERECLDAYVKGLSEAGWRVTAVDVLVGYLLSLVLRETVGALPAILGITLHPEQRSAVEKIFGCPFDVLVENTAAVMRFVQPRIRRASEILGL
jgi:hypothetical protein